MLRQLLSYPIYYMRNIQAKLSKTWKLWSVTSKFLWKFGCWSPPISSIFKSAGHRIPEMVTNKKYILLLSSISFGENLKTCNIFEKCIWLFVTICPTGMHSCFSCFHIEIAYSNFTFCGAYTLSFLARHTVSEKRAHSWLQFSPMYVHIRSL